VSKGRKRTMGLDLHIRRDVGRRSKRKRQVYETIVDGVQVGQEAGGGEEWLPGSWPEVAVVQQRQEQQQRQ
jgi:hypothetical protein